MKFDRFRAYTKSEGTRSAHVNVEDDEGRVTRERKVVDRWPVEDVAFEGEASGADGDTASFNAGDTEITRVVFYRGDVESERVVHSAEINRSGKITIKLQSPRERA